jgi:hypothetical protein
MVFAFLALAAQQPANREEVNVRDFYSTPAMPIGEDVTAIQKAIDEAIKRGGGTVRIPNIGRSYVLTRPIVIAPSKIDYWMQARLRIIGDGNVGQLRYVGPPGLAAIRALAPNLMDMENINLDLEQSNCIGIELTHITADGRRKSVYDNRLTRCRVRMKSGVKNSVGFAVGTGAIPPEFGDTTMVILEQCSSVFEPNYSGERKSAEFIKFIAEQGNVGYSINGLNTLANQFIGCNAVGMRVGYALKNDGNLKDSSNANGTNNFIECQGNFTALMFSMPGGTQTTIRAGRLEHVGALLHIGPPGNPGSEDGMVAVYDMAIDTIHAERNKEIGILNDNALIGLHFNGSMLLQNVSLGDTGPEQIFSIHSLPTTRPARRLITVISSRQEYGRRWDTAEGWRSAAPSGQPWRAVVDGREVWRNN